jgi:AcrR family transcriptional regulator
MPAAPSIAKSSSPKRDHLIVTAERLFYRDGYRAIGIDTILAEANVAKMTLYNNFPSKEELIVAVLEKLSRDVIASLNEAISKSGRSPFRRLPALFDWLRAWFESGDFNGCAFIRALSEYPETNHPIHQAALRHKRAFNAVILELAQEAELKQPDAFATAVAMLIDGAIVAAHATGTSESADSARAAMNNLLKLSKG